MVFKRFRFAVIFQVILIALTPAAFFWTIDQEFMLITSSSLAILWILQIIYLIWYLQKVNRDLSKFISALKYDDITLSFDKNQLKDPHFKGLYTELTKIISEISDIRSEKESDYHFFINTVKHVSTGILAFDENGKIEIYNQACLDLFNIKTLNNLTDINQVEKGLSDTFQNIKPGKTHLLKLIIHNNIVQLSIKPAIFRIKRREIKLLALQNIKTEIEHSEINAWQKLIRVLTHEIMNSVSPIKLLSKSLIDMYEKDSNSINPSEVNNKTIDDTVLGLKTIKKRSDGLSNFVETYKNLTHIPKADFSSFTIQHLFNHLLNFFKDDFLNKNITFRTTCNPTNLKLIADEKLLEQVLINLIKNASESSNNNLEIELSAIELNDAVQIQVIDNGKGIPNDLIEHIFTPFFTTKEKGSGIGLSLSRQIMHLHNGSISVQSDLKKGTTFTLKF